MAICTGGNGGSGNTIIVNCGTDGGNGGDGGGTITGVTAGTNLNGGGTSGNVTIGLSTSLTGLTNVSSSAVSGAFAGDGSGLTGVSAEKLQGTPVSSTGPANGQVLSYNGTSWVPTYGAGGGFANLAVLPYSQSMTVDQNPVTISGTVFVDGNNYANTSSTRIAVAHVPEISIDVVSLQVGSSSLTVLPFDISFASGSLPKRVNVFENIYPVLFELNGPTGLGEGSDLSGALKNVNVVALQGAVLSSSVGRNGPKQDGDVLTWNSGSQKWVPSSSAGGFPFLSVVPIQQEYGFGFDPSPTPITGTHIIDGKGLADPNSIGVFIGQAYNAKDEASLSTLVIHNSASSILMLQEEILFLSGTSEIKMTDLIISQQQTSDISGTLSLNDMKVVGLQGVPVTSSAPTNGQVLTYNGEKWVPSGSALTLPGTNLISSNDGSTLNLTSSITSGLDSITGLNNISSTSITASAIHAEAILSITASQIQIQGFQTKFFGGQQENGSSISLENNNSMTMSAQGDINIFSQNNIKISGSAINIQNKSFDIANPTDGQAIAWNQTLSKYMPTTTGSGGGYSSAGTNLISSNDGSTLNLTSSITGGLNSVTGLTNISSTNITASNIYADTNLNIIVGTGSPTMGITLLSGEGIASGSGGFVAINGGLADSGSGGDVGIYGGYSNKTCGDVILQGGSNRESSPESYDIVPGDVEIKGGSNTTIPTASYGSVILGTKEGYKVSNNDNEMKIITRGLNVEYPNIKADSFDSTILVQSPTIFLNISGTFQLNTFSPTFNTGSFEKFAEGTRITVVQKATGSVTLYDDNVYGTLLRLSDESITLNTYDSLQFMFLDNLWVQVGYTKVTSSA